MPFADERIVCKYVDRALTCNFISCTFSRHRFGHVPTARRKALPIATRTDPMLKELLVSLVTAGFLTRNTMSAVVQGMKRSWEVFEMTQQGTDWLAKEETERDAIMLPMPQVTAAAPLCQALAAR